MKKEMNPMNTGGAGLGFKGCGSGMKKSVQVSGPQCQSCGRTLRSPELFGSEARGIMNTNFCKHCYARGEFTEPDITVEGMIEKVTGILSGQGKLTPEEARQRAEKLIPALRRWRTQAKDKGE